MTTRGAAPMRRPAVMPDGPTAWDLLLYRNGVKVEDAHRVPEIREFVRENRGRRYIPERVLKALGHTEDL